MKETILAIMIKNGLEKIATLLTIKKKYVSPYKLWDNSLNSKLPTIQIEHDEIMDSEKGLIKWLELLHYNGIAIVKNAPIEKNLLFQF